VFANTGEPSRARTCDPLIMSSIKSRASVYGSYDLLAFVTGCSRRGVHLLPLVQTSFAVALSQDCRNRLVSIAKKFRREQNALIA
jgi:hypothetical protein